MTTQRNRSTGEGFSNLEGQLLDLLCGGRDRQSEMASAQRITATWGGYELAEVSDAAERLGLLEQWVEGGRLHSINYMPFGDEHVELPSPAEFEISLIDREVD